MLFFLLFLPKKIMLNVSCELYALFQENEDWHFVWIVCLEDNSHKMSILISLEMSSHILERIKENIKRLSDGPFKA